MVRKYERPEDFAPSEEEQQRAMRAAMPISRREALAHAARLAGISDAVIRSSVRTLEDPWPLERATSEALGSRDWGTKPTLALSALVVPKAKLPTGTLIAGTSIAWAAIIEMLGVDWRRAFEIPPEKWEEIIAGAFKRADYDEVILTPRSRDHGRDVVAIKKGVGCIKIIGSVKAYKAGHLVEYDDVRALLGVMSGESNTSKGILATTSNFPPLIERDPFISPFLPTRLELMNGEGLRAWLLELVRKP
jgi:restriction system protein